MKKNNQEFSVTERDKILSRIYEIALEPSTFDDFIDFWHDTDIATHFGDNEGNKTGDVDKTYRAHLERAQSFLQLSETARPDLSGYLKPFDNLAAFIVTGSLLVEACNLGAQKALSVHAGDSLDQLGIPLEMREALISLTKAVLHGTDTSDRLLKTELDAKNGSLLFRVMRIETAITEGPIALIVSTHFHWRKTTKSLLSSVYNLTQAEQEIVRLLTEGLSTKSVALARETSEGTVRGQIKTIMSKMNLRSQSQIIRFAMTLGEFPNGTEEADGIATLSTPELTYNWLEKEVWKPFKSITVPDGRTLTYHDMGAPAGNPILFSHMGSCMVRWSRSMIQLAYENNLRVICPIRAGYGHSDSLASNALVFDKVREDTIFLLNSLGIAKIPYAVHGSDFPFAADLIAKQPDIVSELIGIGAQPCLPDGSSVNGKGLWQKFFVSTARNAPNMIQFASMAVMAMSKRIGPEAMLRKLCKDSPADLALLEIDEIKEVLKANINLMAGKSTNAGKAFAMDYIAFQEDWSDRMNATRNIPMKMFIAEEDPTIDLSAVPIFKEAYPWIDFEVLPDTGLALMYQKPEMLIPLMSQAAKRTVSIFN